MNLKPRVMVDPDRERCPRCDKLLRADGRCWACLKRPEEYASERGETRMPVEQLSIESQVQLQLYC